MGGGREGGGGKYGMKGYKRRTERMMKTAPPPPSTAEAVTRPCDQLRPYLNLPIFLRWLNISPPGTYSRIMYKFELSCFGGGGKGGTREDREVLSTNGTMIYKGPSDTPRFPRHISPGSFRAGPSFGLYHTPVFCCFFCFSVVFDVDFRGVGGTFLIPWS